METKEGVADLYLMTMGVLAVREISLCFGKF